LDTFSSARRPKNSGVIWKKKWSSNTSNVGETTSASVCNDGVNVSCNPRMCDLLDDNNFFIFDDVNVRISPVSKMPFMKNPRDSMNVFFKSNSNKSLPRTVHKWLHKWKPLAEPVAKWFPRIVHICLWIIASGCSNNMTGNRALLMNFVEKFLRTVCFGNNDFAVIAGYGDVVIDEASEVIISFIKKTQVNLQLHVQRVRTDNGTEFKNKTLAKFFDEIMKSSTTNVETPINEEVFHEEIWLRVQQMMKGSDIGIQDKKAKLFNEWERQIAQPGMNMGQDRQMQMIGGNGRNQFRQYAGQNTGNLNGYNAVQNVRNQVAQNPRVHNDGIQNQIGNGNLMAGCAEGNAAGHNGNQIRCYNCRGTDSTPVNDSDGSDEVHEHCDNNEIFNMFTQEDQYT
nr:hypothetical protein [Tanacetum cinerariifolium]GFA24045.1 hypothetical protein [Tanacetum cinerariifolium]